MPATVAGVRFAGGPSYTYTYTYNAEHERTRLVHSTLGTFIYVHPNGSGELLYEKEVQPGGLTEHKNYINAAGILIGVLIKRSNGTSETRYFHQGRLGSIATITNATGGVMERLAYEAFGKRRNANGSDNPNNSLFGINTDRGFTGHEHLDEVALIHMNGRIYDPVLGRFITADPNVQFPTNLQSYNRYSYALNNPLRGSDPTGFFSFGDFIGDIFGGIDDVIGDILGGVADVVESVVDTAKNVVEAALSKPLKTIATVAVAYYTGYWFGEGLGLATASTTGSSAFGAYAWTAQGAVFELTTLGSITANAGTGFTLGLISSKGDFDAGLRGAASGAILGGVDAYFGNAPGLERFVAKSVAGGVAAKIQGGSFEEGVLTSVVTGGARYIYNSMVGCPRS